MFGKKGAGRPEGSTKAVVNEKFINEFYEKYGSEGLRTAIEVFENVKSGKSVGEPKETIKFDVVFTKEDFKDAQMREIIMQILEAGRPAEQAPQGMTPADPFANLPEPIKKQLGKFMPGLGP